MKKLIYTAAIVLMSTFQLTATTVNTDSSKSFDVIENEKKIILNLSKLNNEIQIFTITNTEGEEVFSEKVNKYEKDVEYDLSTLAIGLYTIKIEGENFIEIHTTEITADQVHFKNVESHVAPTFQEANEILIVEAAFSNEENVHVNIYNSLGDLVFKFTEKTNTVHKKFNLEKLEKGNYNIIVSTDFFSQSKTISI